MVQLVGLCLVSKRSYYAHMMSLISEKFFKSKRFCIRTKKIYFVCGFHSFVHIFI